MPFSIFKRSAASSGGVATVDISDTPLPGVQVSIHDVTTGTGVVTITAMPAGTDEFQAVDGATADISDTGEPWTFSIPFAVDQVKATGPVGDAFTLLVGK